MKQIKIFDNLIMFSTYNEHINLSFNQYLLLGEEPILIHTGSHAMTEKLVPKVNDILGDRELAYVFISHFESDECGGLAHLLKHFPAAKPICSAVTARQLTGFGMMDDVIVKSAEDTLSLKDLNLKFVAYPSEMHLWEGLLLFEENQGILFSSDLFVKQGNLSDTIVNSNLSKEISKIASHQIPNPVALKIMQDNLAKLPVKYIVPGHGSVLKL